MKQVYSIILFISFCLLPLFSQGQAKVTLNRVLNELTAFHISQKETIKSFYANLNSSPFRQLALDSTFLLSEVTPSGFPIFKAPLNAGAALTTGVTSLQNQALGLNLQGENMIVNVWDNGLVKDHVELGNRILTKEGQSFQNHATHVTGTIIATGINAAAKGMAPLANAMTWDYDNDEAEIAAMALSNQGVLFSNHSYGIVTGWTKVNGAWFWSGDATISTTEDYRAGFYGDHATVLDQIAYSAPYYTIVWAAGNDRAEVGDGSHPPDGNGGTGYDCIIPQSVAKNIITVGAVSKITTYTDPSSVVMSNFSSWGPTDDGRIKPDLVGAGVNIFSLSAAGTNQYAGMSGTSMATPNVTGSLMLIQELYGKLHGGRFMKASTLKALAIHTTKEAGTFPGPDYSYGWGLLDVQAAANVLLLEDNTNTFIEEHQLTNGQTFSMNIASQANQKITVTLCWTDPAGTSVAASLDPTELMLVNDLDVRIVNDGGTKQFPWILNPGSPANKATTGDNFRDNVEKIEFNNPLATNYTINVSHKGSLANGVQDFSIIVTCKSSVTSGSTYYWIGNDGDWSDGSHWSLTTGGISANTIPTINDNVIFDANSFDGISLRAVSLSSDMFCNNVITLTDRQAELKLNNHQLTIKGNVSIAAPNFKITSDGVLSLNGIGSHSLNIQQGNFSTASLDFSGGKWTVTGTLHVQKINIKNDSVMLQSGQHFIKELNAAMGTYLDIRDCIIDSLEQSGVMSNQVMSEGSNININTTASLNWGINYKGQVSLTDNAKTTLSGTDTLQSLVLHKGSILTLANATTHYVANLSIDSVAGSEVEILSPGKATISITGHQKFCFDSIRVTNVDVEGASFVNSGLHSVIVNSKNWLEQKCDQVLYPDCDVKYPCQNALTSFEDKSMGSVVSWLWNFGDELSGNNTSDKQNPFHRFSGEGTFQVSLTVSDGSVNHSYTRDVIIGPNISETNSIVSAGGALMSFLVSSNYQWYRNGEPIPDATSRVYEYNGDNGSYEVVIDANDCNLASEPFVITGMDDISSGILIFPNPATDFVKIKAQGLSHLVLYDILGQPKESLSFENEYALDIRGLKNGMYNLQVHTSSSSIQRKILVQH